MLKKDEIDSILETARSGVSDFSELFLEDREDIGLSMSSGSMDSATSMHIHGAGLCVMNGCHRIYLHTNDTSFSSLKELAMKAAEMTGAEQNPKPRKNVQSMNGKCIEVPLSADGMNRRAAVVRDMYAAAMATGVNVRSLLTKYSEEVQNIVVANSDGLYEEDRRTFSHIRFNATVEACGSGEYDFGQIGVPGGFDDLMSSVDAADAASEHVRRMADRLRAEPVVSCVVPVVFEGGAGGGVLWHEMCGHNLETTSIINGTSDFIGKIGRRVASEKVTLIDDGSIPGLCGTEKIDDEGTKTRKNVLIEKGILKNYLADRFGSRRLNVPMNGSGRRQNYTFAPTARMHNTYLAAGEDDEEDIIRSIPEGLYVKSLGGGEEGTVFSIAVKDAFWIKNGQIDHRVKNLTLSGNALEILKRVDRVGRRLIKDNRGGYCGAASGLVETTCFAPMIRVSAMNVAGSGTREE